jgi:hypothetical protein
MPSSTILFDPATNAWTLSDISITPSATTEPETTDAPQMLGRSGYTATRLQKRHDFDRRWSRCRRRDSCSERVHSETPFELTRMLVQHPGGFRGRPWGVATSSTGHVFISECGSNQNCGLTRLWEWGSLHASNGASDILTGTYIHEIVNPEANVRSRGSTRQRQQRLGRQSENQLGGEIRRDRCSTWAFSPSERRGTEASQTPSRTRTGWMGRLTSAGMQSAISSFPRQETRESSSTRRVANTSQPSFGGIAARAITESS